MHFWGSLSGKVCETIMTKNMRPYLLLRPVGMDFSMLRARSGVRQFSSFVFKECGLYSFDACFIRYSCLVHCRSSYSAPIMVSGMSK
jgi:hypothetical protein